MTALLDLYFVSVEVITTLCIPHTLPKLYRCRFSTQNDMRWIFGIQSINFFLGVLSTCLLNSYYYTHVICGEITSKLSGPANSNNEGNYPTLFYVENTKISVYVQSPHYFSIFFWECRTLWINPTYCHVIFVSRQRDCMFWPRKEEKQGFFS